MLSFNNLFRNLNLSKKSQLDSIFRTKGSIMVEDHGNLPVPEGWTVRRIDANNG